MSEANAIRILLVAAPHGPFAVAADMARELGADVATAPDADAALAQLRERGADLAMVDVDQDVGALVARLRAERIALPVLACGIDAPAAQAVAAIRAGAYDYVPLPPQRDLIAAVILSTGQRQAELIGNDPALVRARDYALALAPSALPILVSGERGTGKDVLARLIHRSSHRSGRFLALECAGVSAELVESELLGHVPGDFPGAQRRVGRFEEARGGTLFLRHVDALPNGTQARLLDALQQDRLRPGAGDKAPAAPRVLASSSADLEARVVEGLFRADLLAYLSVAKVELPPLRERGDDINRLAAHFADRFALANGLPPRSLTGDALLALRTYDWPGNVAELENLMHRAVLLAQGDAISADDIRRSDGAPLVHDQTEEAGTDLDVAPLIGHSMADVERELILQTLQRCGGNRTSASTILGISVRTMRNKLRSFIDAGIPVSPAL